MVAKESVKKRLDSENGFSFTEFCYQLLQGYDYLYLHQHKNCKLQMGGSDQWGNITTGIELIRKKTNQEAFALTCPLLTKADGGKFGKSEQGNIWLDATKTSPFAFYQFWINTSDEDAKNWIKIFTFLDVNTINKLIEEHQENPHKRILQKTLATELTIFIHGKEHLDKAIFTSSILFDNGTAENLLKLDKETFLQMIATIPKIKIDKKIIKTGSLLLTLLVDTQIFSSKSEAKKMIQNGGISINKNKVQKIEQTVNLENIIFNNYILIQKGKKQYFIFSIENS